MAENEQREEATLLALCDLFGVLLYNGVPQGPQIGEVLQVHHDELCTPDQEGRTPLHHLALSEELRDMEEEEYVSAVAAWRVTTVLHKASASKEVEAAGVKMRLLCLTRILAAYPAYPVNHVDEQGDTAALLAARSGSLRVLRIIAEHPDIQLLRRDARGRMPLYYVLTNTLARPPLQRQHKEKVRLDTVKLLLPKSSHANVDLSEGNSALHCAALAPRNCAVISFLLTGIAHPLHRNHRGETSLHCAVMTGCRDNIDLLVNACPVAKYVRSKAGRLPCDYFSEEYSLEEAMDRTRMYVAGELYSALRKEDLYAVEAYYLNQFGLDPGPPSPLLPTRVYSDIQRSALCVGYTLAIALGGRRIITWFTNTHHAAIDFERHSSPDGVEAIAILACNPIPEDSAVEELFKGLVGTSRSATEYRTPSDENVLHLASVTDNLRAVRYLLQNAVIKPNQTTRQGYTELHYAVLTGDPVLVQTMLSANADPEAGPPQSLPYAWAVAGRDLEIIAKMKSALSEEVDPSVDYNAASLRILGAKGLVIRADEEKDESSRIFVTVAHHLKAKVKTIHTPLSRPGNRCNPSFEMTEGEFAIRAGQNISRKVDIVVYITRTEGATARIVGKVNLYLDKGKNNGVVELPLMTQDGVQGSVSISVTYTMIASGKMHELLKEYLKHKWSVFKAMKKHTGGKTVGDALQGCGYRPKYPVLLLQGFTASKLYCVFSDTKRELEGQRLWVDFTRTGGITAMKNEEYTEETDLERTREMRRRNKIMNHILLDEVDGVSDPPGICVRTREGVEEMYDVMSGGIGSALGQIYGRHLKILKRLGYKPEMLKGFPYDWRVDFNTMERRDGLFSRMKVDIEIMRRNAGRGVVMTCFSMGNRCTHYFLNWIRDNYGIAWIEHHIHALFSIGSPWAGSVPGFQSLFLPTRGPLALLLTGEEILGIQRQAAVLNFIPTHWSMRPDPELVHLRDESNEKIDISWRKLVEMKTPRMLNIYDNLFRYDKYIFNDAPHEGTSAPILRPPLGIKLLWNNYGVDVPTVIKTYYRKSGNNFTYDASADKEFGSRVCEENPRGLSIVKGEAEEDGNTLQPCDDTTHSGDGSVEYCSLSWPDRWKEAFPEEDVPSIHTTHAYGVVHSDSNFDAEILKNLFDLVCEGGYDPVPFFREKVSSRRSGKRLSGLGEGSRSSLANSGKAGSECPESPSKRRSLSPLGIKRSISSLRGKRKGGSDMRGSSGSLSYSGDEDGSYMAGAAKEEPRSFSPHRVRSGSGASCDTPENASPSRSRSNNLSGRLLRSLSPKTLPRQSGPSISPKPQRTLRPDGEERRRGEREERGLSPNKRASARMSSAARSPPTVSSTTPSHSPTPTSSSSSSSESSSFSSSSSSEVRSFLQKLPNKTFDC